MKPGLCGTGNPACDALNRIIATAPPLRHRPAGKIACATQDCLRHTGLPAPHNFGDFYWLLTPGY